MAGASDKARFYLEQSVPELQELERKQIFSKTEITAITKKRSDFEHKLNARGSYPADYARYAEYEMNLEALRRKRIKRLGIKGATKHVGQRRIFFILDRATRKFHGDVGLWMQYIEYAKKEKSYKKLSQILSSVLRMHPTKPELWLYAAQSAIDLEADMTAARGYMQRGLRFCKNSKTLWLEYAKLEMIYIAKIAARRTILGLDQELQRKAEGPSLDDHDADMLALPEITAEDIDPSLRKDNDLDQLARQNLESMPAFTGAIPMAVFDTGMKQFQDDDTVGEMFFNMFAEFEKLPCLPTILQHVVDRMLAHTPLSPSTLTCYCRQPIVGVDVVSADFPAALGVSIERLREASPKATNQARFAEKSLGWLLPPLAVEELDTNIRKVIAVVVRQSIRSIGGEGAELNAEKVAALGDKLHGAGLQEDAMRLLSKGIELYGSHDGLLAIQDKIQQSQ
ncbi:hypothetical protein L228DRAFT_221982 [Xylona heveae TC161]|uniref:U3 small nucleolar RNA-associated protein 6 N-terminal domain-containing protein n=1 Tax=Xylona heveae (strain CBS 132557 / TC161) TaxID=1328760 RepID=A0A165G9S4_XYLHT|nr:hypothetical protein L228DRAFT_221982 [Xylona heveae TC161]KZF21917.1 hypothetical protein L228DRAFT_221982 [Xylona heveae TC161]